MELKLYDTTSSKLSTLETIGGQVIVSKDDACLYIDMDSVGRLKITDWIELKTDNDRLAVLAPIAGKIYYVIETNAIWKYIEGKWKYLNEINKEELLQYVLENLVISETNNGNKIEFWTGTKEEYNNLGTYDDNCLYVITDDEPVVPVFEQATPLFAESVEELDESGDKSKLYVLPDGFIYAYMYSESIAPSYTNLAGTITYDRRLSSSGKASSSAMAGACYTGFIPVKKGQIIRIKNLDVLTPFTSSAFPYVCFYTGASEDNVLSSNPWDRINWMLDNDTKSLFVRKEDDGTIEYTAFVATDGAGGSSSGSISQHKLASTITHVRFSGWYESGKEVIVTVDEEITEGGGGGYSWQSTGHAFVPADYETEITNLKNNKANKGDIPTKLPNPYALKINGVEYDGSKEVEITVTGGNSGGGTNINLFSFEDADDNFSWISGSAENMIYETSSSHGYKDTVNNRFVSLKAKDSGRFAVTGGLPDLPAGDYVLTAEVFIPSDYAHNHVNFGVCQIPSNKSNYVSKTITAKETWTEVSYSFTVPESDLYTYIALMSYGEDAPLYWRNIKVVSASASENGGSADYDGNILKGKKWVVCGDSLSSSGYTSADGFDESVYIYQDGRFAGKNKVYPFMIGLRNNMNIVNLATGGQTMAASSNSFMTRYTQVDADADYITIYLGTNDEGNGIPVGTLEDSTDATFCGAYNIAMEHILENHPFAHIGIVVANHTNAEYMEMTRKMAERWGVPCLDLGSPQVPLMNRYTGRNVCAKAQEIREKNFNVRIDANGNVQNAHPNTAAQEYFSTFFEAWLRTL